MTERVQLFTKVNWEMHVVFGDLSFCAGKMMKITPSQAKWVSWASNFMGMIWRIPVGPFGLGVDGASTSKNHCLLSQIVGSHICVCHFTEVDSLPRDLVANSWGSVSSGVHLFFALAAYKIKRLTISPLLSNTCFGFEEEVFEEPLTHGRGALQRVGQFDSGNSLSRKLMISRLDVAICILEALTHSRQIPILNFHVKVNMMWAHQKPYGLLRGLEAVNAKFYEILLHSSGYTQSFANALRAEQRRASVCKSSILMMYARP